MARQLNEAIGAARTLLKTSLTDSRLDLELPLARHAISSVGALSFKIGDLSNPKPAKPAGGRSTWPASPRSPRRSMRPRWRR